RTGDDSHTSGTGVRRSERVTRECTYQDFMKCQPLYFKSTEGVVELTQWFERMETVFRISNCLAKNQIELKKKMADKYFPRNKMKKIETELWNLEVQGTDLTCLLLYVNFPFSHSPYYPFDDNDGNLLHQGCQIVDKCKTGLGYNAVLPPYKGNFMPSKPDLSFSDLEEFVNEPIVKKPVFETTEAKASADKPKVIRKNLGSLLIKDWISNIKDEAESKPNIEKKTVKPSFAKIKFVKSKEQVKSPRKTIVKQGNHNRLNTHNPRGNQRN
nr:hypothetical protein [Tanacetum cinerariifolium]